MIKNPVIILPVVSLLFVSSCATDTFHTRKAPSEYFVTHITEDGVKQFSYSLEVSASQRNRRAKGGGRMNGRSMGGGMGGGRGMSANTKSREELMAMRKEKILDRIISRLENKLSEAGYCHETYITIDEYIGAGNARIQGKCTDKATSQDKVKFVNEPV